jgi:hypothetical protein
MCKKKTEVIQNYRHIDIRRIGQDEARHRKIRELNLAVVKLTTVQVADLPL